jgi:hypothetical protein
MRKAIIEVLGAVFANAPLSDDAKGRRSRQVVFAVVVLLFFVVMVATLTGCVTDDFSLRHPELVVEGNESSYPAFEAAAEACAYRAFSRFPGATVQGSVTVGPHFNLFQTRTGPARCVVRWVGTHPATGLYVSYH